MDQSLDNSLIERGAKFQPIEANVSCCDYYLLFLGAPCSAWNILH